MSTKTGMHLINKASIIKVDVLDEDFIDKNRENFPAGDVTGDFQTHAALRQRRTRQREDA